MFSLVFAMGGVLAGLFCGWLVVHYFVLDASAEDVKFPIGGCDVSMEEELMSE